MLSLILAALLLIVYALGAVIAREYMDSLLEQEEAAMLKNDYWWFIATWPYQVAAGLFSEEEE